LKNVSLKSVIRVLTILTDTEAETEENIIILRPKADGKPVAQKSEPPAGHGP
jgi:hypothetical protein